MAVVKKCQNSFTSGVLSPNVAARTDIQKYAAGCQRIINGIVHVHGGVSNRPGTVFVNEIPGPGLLIPFSYSVEQTYVLAFFDAGFGKTKMRVYTGGGVVVAGDTPVEVATPYLPGELSKIKFTQSADTLFLAHPEHRPFMLVRVSHTEWVFREMSFLPSIAAPTGLKATASNFVDETETYYEVEASYKVAAVNDREAESMPSAAASVNILSTWPSGARVTLEWEAVTGAIRYEVYKNTRGWYEWLGSASETKFTDDNIDGDDSIGPKENRDPFNEPGTYPGAVGIYQQRLVFGRSNREPQTVWLSETGSFDSMAVAQPLRDDSAITATIDSRQMNEIRHFIPLRDMLMLTSGAEFKMGATNGGAVTPTSIQFGIQSYWGSSDVPPVVSGTSIVMVQNSGRHVRDLHYQLSEDGYSGNDVSVLAEHLIDSPIHDWAYQQSPYSTIWICLESGRLLSLTYMRDQEVFAWAEHESSGGKFRSVSVVREGQRDSVYFIVERDGRFFVEYQIRRDYGDDARLSHFVDCGLQYADESNPITHVTGLEHLAGKEIVVLADGSVVRGVKVKLDGSFDLSFPASFISAGLPYTMTVETLDPEIRSDQGSIAGERRCVSRVVLQLQETRGLEVGPDEGRLVALKQPVPPVYGAPPPLVTGEVNLAIPGVHRESASVVLRQSDPLPATVLALTTWISVG